MKIENKQKPPERSLIGSIFISAGSGMLAYYQLPDWFPNFFKR
jgi:hypothetical protein